MLKHCMACIPFTSQNCLCSITLADACIPLSRTLLKFCAAPNQRWPGIFCLSTTAVKLPNWGTKAGKLSLLLNHSSTPASTERHFYYKSVFLLCFYCSLCKSVFFVPFVAAITLVLFCTLFLSDAPCILYVWVSVLFYPDYAFFCLYYVLLFLFWLFILFCETLRNYVLKGATYIKLLLKCFWTRQR